MRGKLIFKLNIKSTKSLRVVDDYLDAVKLHCVMLPEYIPMKFDWGEPLKQTLNPEDLRNMVFSNGNVGNIWWKRTIKPKANGSWMYSANRSGDPSKFTHSDISFNFTDVMFQTNIVEYFKKASLQSSADIGFIDSMADDYEELAKINKFAPFGSELMLSTKLLRNWLPEMPWSVVFGPAYVHMFGKQKVLSTPAHKVEEIGEDMIFIQLTEKMQDIHERYEFVMEAREIAKQHLGKECFFDLKLNYDFNVEVQNAGKVYKVPEFIFNSE